MIDGVIKYHIEYQTEAAPVFPAYTELEELRSRLFALGLIGETNEGIGYGNLSKRSQGKTFFITATQTGKQATLSKEQYTFIDNYDFNTFTVNSKGEHKPSSEALSHAMIYEIHPDIQAVIHIHSKPLWEFMQRNHALATTAEYGTAQMVTEIAALYEKSDPFTNNAFVMKGHEDGIISFGRNIEEAELTLYRIIQQHFTI